MIELLEFVFRDGWTFWGVFLLVLIICWGIGNIRLFTINHYHDREKEANATEKD